MKHRGIPDPVVTKKRTKCFVNNDRPSVPAFNPSIGEAVAGGALSSLTTELVPAQPGLHREVLPPPSLPTNK